MQKMGVINKMKELLKKLLPDKIFLNIKYKKVFGKKLDLKNPKTFNEKLQWLKLYDRNPIYTTLVDKYEVKYYVANLIGEEFIIPTYGIYNNFDEIDFNSLPNQFVIKCTHDSGGLIIVKDKSKFDIDSAREKIKKSLKTNYYYSSREWPYKNVKPRIIIEKYMEDDKTKDLKDYKFFVFNGKVNFFKIDFNRFTKHQANYYDLNGNILNFGEEICPPNYNIKIDMPYNLKKMVELAEKLANDIPFIRVDFYETNKKIFFGELTFYPAGGFGKFSPQDWDIILGRKIQLFKQSYEKRSLYEKNS